MKDNECECNKFFIFSHEPLWEKYRRKCGKRVKQVLLVDWVAFESSVGFLGKKWIEYLVWFALLKIFGKFRTKTKF